jgi:hypothetical protein
MQPLDEDRFLVIFVMAALNPYFVCQGSQKLQVTQK